MEEEKREEEVARMGTSHGEGEGKERNNQVLPFSLFIYYLLQVTPCQVPTERFLHIFTIYRPIFG